MYDQVKQRIHILGKVFYSCPTLILASCFSHLTLLGIVEEHPLLLKEAAHTKTSQINIVMTI
ncbi:hypothetical protein HanXRQr2_Chr13g0594121 [Helianthus annuus]|uniref:Uncharacterized protein n=1 Tax=Helianthus annuus TaxID=4232 RepID=A0A9K3EJ04_HELAN|nr:hypothetical protein HanXRQr2_Chr13g0594121 [Helianthus annuus]